MVEYGFNVHDPFNPKILGTGAKWVRMDVDIAVTPPWAHGQNAEDLIRGYREQGFKILAILTYGSSAPWTDVSREFSLYDWRMKVRAFVDAFAGLVDAYEIWNEPESRGNQWGYWDGTPQHYYDMLRGAYEDIKARDPTAIVLAGSLEDFNNWGPGSGGYLLAEIWKLGAAAYCNAVSIHIYDYLLHTYTSSGAVELINNLTNKPVWITEIGATSTDVEGISGVPPGMASEVTQRDWMHDKFSDLEAGRVKPAVVLWYIFYEPPENAFSVVNLDYTEKLAYQEFKSFATPISPLGWLIPIGIGAFLLSAWGKSKRRG